MNEASTSMMMKGKMALERRARLILEMEQATKRQAPTGGVMRAMLSDSTMMMPKWIGAIPMLTAIGWSMGPRMMRAAAMSMNIPTMSISTRIMRRMSFGLPVVAMRKAA